MVEPLRRRLLGMGVSSDAAACAGVFVPSDKAYPTDMLAEWLQERTQQLLAESEDLISQAHALIKQQAADLASSWTDWTYCWNELAKTHTLLHVYLDKVFYKAEQAKQETCLTNLSCLVCSTSFLRKLLANESCWSKTIVQNYELFQLLLDEAHQEGWLKQAGVVAHFPRVALFGDGYQTQGFVGLRGDHALKKQGGLNCSGEDGQDPIDWTRSFGWLSCVEKMVGAQPIPKFSMNSSYRLGQSICNVLRDSQLVPSAVSCCPHDTVLNLILYDSTCPARQAPVAPFETYYHEFSFRHLVLLLTLELFKLTWAESRVQTLPPGQVFSKENRVAVMVLVFYRVLARHLQAWLKPAIKATWYELWKTMHYVRPDPAIEPIFLAQLERVPIELILPSGGRECDVSFIVAPRRNASDQTWSGHHLLDQAWLYIGLSRASHRCYLFMEDVAHHQLSYQRQENKRQKWVSIQQLGMMQWNTAGINQEQQVSITKADQIPQILYSSTVREALGLGFNRTLIPQLQRGFETQNELLARSWDLWELPNHVPSGQTMVKAFSDALQDKRWMENLVSTLQRQAVPAVRLPAPSTNYMPTTSSSATRDDTLQKRNAYLQSQQYRFLDCMTVHTRSSQICISIVLMMADSTEDEYNGTITNQIAASLFDGWDVPSAVFEKGVGKHKKTEIEGLGDGEQTHYFFEAQCNADRPAWILESPESGREVFHLYNAMGLARQHPMLQSLLARVYISKEVLSLEDSCSLAASFCTHVTKTISTVSCRSELISADDADVGLAFQAALELCQTGQRPRRDLEPYRDDDLANHLAQYR
jgi:hypothetical protein